MTNYFQSNNIGLSISVVLLTYNHVHLIESTVSSIIKQSISGYEIIISDDCSTDGTWELLMQMVKKYPDIKCIQTPKNMGMAGNANFAINQSNREFIALLHHDDIYSYELLEEWHKKIAINENVGFVFNLYGIYGSKTPLVSEFEDSILDGHTLLNSYLLDRWGCPVRGTAMIRRTAWESVGGLRTEFGLLADVDLWMRMCRFYNVGYVDKPIIKVRQDRPENYDDLYSESRWSWKRRGILYKIHIKNYEETLNFSNYHDLCVWIKFKYRLNFDVIKWLTYAIVRKKWYMITTSLDAETTCDLILVRFVRNSLMSVTKFLKYVKVI